MRSLKRSERGANLVEFAMVAPFLILLLVGVVEFSWTLATNLDVKQGAREGARLTAESDDGSPDVGDGVIGTVRTPHQTLIGILDPFFSGLSTLESSVEIRIEKPPDWTDGTEPCP